MSARPQPDVVARVALFATTQAAVAVATITGEVAAYSSEYAVKAAPSQCEATPPPSEAPDTQTSPTLFPEIRTAESRFVSPHRPPYQAGLPPTSEKLCVAVSTIGFAYVLEPVEAEAPMLRSPFFGSRSVMGVGQLEARPFVTMKASPLVGDTHAPLHCRFYARRQPADFLTWPETHAVLLLPDPPPAIRRSTPTERHFVRSIPSRGSSTMDPRTCLRPDARRRN